MIDLHCHILPALDDGALDMADTLAMAAVAERDGVGLVCATPHIHPDHEVRLEELPARVAAVNEALSEEGLSVRVTTGGELAQSKAGSLSDAELGLISLGGSGRWLLLEPSPGPIGADLVTAVDELHERGFSCVIAHPERHAGERFAEWLSALTERSALVQVTAALLAEGPASETMLELARQGLVHLVASDAHSSHGGRPATISQGISKLEQVPHVSAHLDWVANTGPEAIVAGLPAVPPFSSS